MKLKAIYAAIGLTLMSCSLWSCSDKDDLNVLKRDTDSMQFSYLNETKDLHILTNNKWSIISNDSWISCTPSEGVGSDAEQIVKVTTLQNDGAEREGSVTLTDGEKKLNIAISQEDGFFYFGRASMPDALIHRTNISGNKIEIPYYKAKPGYTVSAACEILLDDEPCQDITVEPIVNKELTVGSGVLSLALKGTATTKGNVRALVKLTVNNSDVYDMEATSKVRAERELSVTVFKLLPKLVVIDWGKYAKGTGTNGDNGSPRDFDFELAYEKDGAAIRRSVSQKSNWLVANMFWPENRFVYGNLKPDTDYWFRIVEKNIGDNKETSDVTYLKFHTPAESPLPANTVLYNDFDHFCIKGSAIYRAFGIAISNPEVGKNFDPNSDDAFLPYTGICTPPTTMDPLHDQRNNASHALNYANCPKVWQHFWETDKYGLDGISDLDTYPGWSCYFARQSTGAVMLGGATTSNAYLGTPRLTQLGSTPTDITVVTHTAAYHEPYHSWEEDCLYHYIKIDGPGKIVDGGSTVASKLPSTADPNGDKSIVVEMKPNKEGAGKGSINDYNVTTEHVIKISGATKDTRIKIMNMKIGADVPHARVLIDDILITKN